VVWCSMTFNTFPTFQLVKAMILLLSEERAFK
jgi:hypothetical protein